MLSKDAAPTWHADVAAIGLERGRSLSASIDMDAAPSALWQGITTPGHLKRCHPFCESTTVDTWPGAGSRDSITYYSGRTYRRNFVDWIDGVGYDIELGDRPNPTARVLWRIAPISDTACRLSIEVVPYLKADLSETKKAQYQDRLFGADLQHYLESVVQGGAYWITTGRNVDKDQFGSNPLYSG